MTGFQDRGINELPLPIKTEEGSPLEVAAGSTSPVFVENFKTHSLLQELLVQQKKTNAYLAMITDCELMDEEVQ